MFRESPAGLGPGRVETRIRSGNAVFGGDLGGPVLEGAMRALALPGDGWHIGPRRFTLHTPAGIGRSKLAGKLPRLLPAAMTARNLRTIAALHAMAAARG